LDLPKKGNLHEYLVELEVVSTKLVIEESSAWVFNIVNDEINCLGAAEGEFGSDFPSLDLIEK